MPFTEYPNWSEDLEPEKIESKLVERFGPVPTQKAFCSGWDNIRTGEANKFTFVDKIRFAFNSHGKPIRTEELIKFIYDEYAHNTWGIIVCHNTEGELILQAEITLSKRYSVQAY